MSESNEARRQMKLAASNSEAACRNEAITRNRVDYLEHIVGGFFALPFRHRLKWLIFGFPPAQPAPVEGAKQMPQDGGSFSAADEVTPDVH